MNLRNPDEEDFRGLLWNVKLELRHPNIQTSDKSTSQRMFIANQLVCSPVPPSPLLGVTLSIIGDLHGHSHSTSSGYSA